MDKFVWSERYSVGVSDIDEQHRHFFELANESLELEAAGEATPAAALAALGKLSNYALYHLSTEEEYFAKCQYPEAAWHIAAHEQFRQSVSKYFNEARKEGADARSLMGQVARFAGEWLQKHILEVDRKYVECFHQCGLK